MGSKRKVSLVSHDGQNSVFMLYFSGLCILFSVLVIIVWSIWKNVCIFVIKMKLLRFAKILALYTLLTFCLYDLLWMLVDYGDFYTTLTQHKVELVSDFLYCMFFSATSLAVCMFVTLYFEKKAKNRLPKLILLSWTALAVNILLAFISDYFYEVGVIRNDFNEDLLENIYIFAFIATFISLIHTNHYQARLLVKQYDDYISFRKLSLKKQLDPHFVFNSLSVLTELVRTQPEKAEEFVLTLSSVYRYILGTIDMEIVPLRDALNFARNYTTILQTRFDTNVTIITENLQVSDKYYVLPLSLQIVMENALKHNPPSSDNPLTIRISCDGRFLAISNNRTSTAETQSHAPHGFGLKNLRERYLLEYGVEPRVEKNSNTFTVYVPIIKK